MISSKKYYEMLTYGGISLANKKEYINDLNVFPVPDGDTGTNMCLTYESGIKAIEDKKFNSIGEMSIAFSRGMLLGARGNSGVILSQFFRGISKSFEGKKEVNNEELVSAFKEGKKYAYKAVIEPVEGTMLTAFDYMATKLKGGEEDFFKKLLNTVDKAVEITPKLLKVLKDANVVDSGAYGISCIIEGFYKAEIGEKISHQKQEHFAKNSENLSVEDITFTFCTELLIKLDDLSTSEDEIRNYLLKMGDSIVAIKDEEIFKIHVHTDNPIEVFNHCKKYGTILNLKSENMRAQAEGVLENKQKDQAIVSVCSTTEMGELFNSINEVTVVSGGQTLNPSIEELTEAVKKANAKKVVILPNNSNIILAAKSVNELLEDVEVKVIETKTMSHGLEAVIQFDFELEFNKNIKNLQQIKDSIINYEVTKASKSTVIDDVEITQGDFMEIRESKIINTSADEEKILKDIINQLQEKELITILLGEEHNEDLIEGLEDYLEELDSLSEIIIYKTKQKVYNYIISGV